MASSTKLGNDLIRAMHDPFTVLYSDDFVVIIADRYPKSKYHYLVLPKEHIQDARSLKIHHIPKLVYMELKGLEYAIQTTAMAADNFQVGYHSYPSMNRLHLHVLSKDFQGSCLRHNYQWNSFNTEFFLLTFKLITDLQIKGRVLLPPNKKCLYQPLQCNKCEYQSNEVQNLKLHLTLFHCQPQSA